MESQFINLCSRGDLLGAQQYLKFHPIIHISAAEQAFCYTCFNGHLHVIQWLLQIKPCINISVYNDLAFSNACTNGHLEIAQWLLHISKERGKNINISAEHEYAFRWACFKGHLHVAQLLIQISKERGQDINISAVNDFAFRQACQYRHLAMAQWLQSFKPYLYVIHYDENGNYKDYYIRTKEEANWEKRKYLIYIASDCKEDNLLYRLPLDVAKMIIGYV